MSKQSVNLAFIWHMHQPCYVDQPSGKMLLPWVRLHGVSAYCDMAELLADHKGIKATVSFSPSLLDQIKLYLDGGEDAFEELTRCPASELSTQQRSFLLQHFFSVHWERVISQIPSYRRLLDKRGLEQPRGDGGDWGKTAAVFTDDELRDLQLLFNLAWLGLSGSRDPEIQRLIERGHGYSEEDKQLVLDKQRQLLSGLLPAWRDLISRGSVEVMGTAYYHGLLPLLVDTNIAKRASPEVELPERFSFPQDAQVQLARALRRIEEELGVRPSGLWPPESAISPEVIKLAQAQELRYVVAEGELLFHSLDDRGSTPGRNRLFQPYQVGGCAVFFRDGELSSLIAREYATWDDSVEAAADFISRVRKVGEVAKLDGDGPPLVVIALDGENPWEAYPSRGRPFLSALYQQLSESSEIETVTLSGYLENHQPKIGLDYLHSGSRVEGNFAVWIGDPEKNRAWNLLGRARKRLARAQVGHEVAEELLETATNHLLRAECSDWFWWLGEPFSSVEDTIYETLFRGHLMATYRSLGDSPPADLSRPIGRGEIVEPMRQPTSFINPRIDGVRTAFFEWRGAGFYRVPAGGSMYQKHALITGIYWGFDAGRLFLRLDPVEEHREGVARALDEMKVWFELSAPDRSLVADLVLSPPPSLSLTMKKNGGEHVDLGLVEEVAFEDVVELAIPLSRLGLTPGTRLGLTVHFARAEEVLSTVPRQGVIEVEIPGDEFGDQSVAR